MADEHASDLSPGDIDMAPPELSTTHPPRVTPRNSTLEEELKNKETPYASLVELAKQVNKPSTPERTAPSPGQRKSTRRTPGAGRLNPRVTAKSPHAVRAFEQRRAATPGREQRRKSGRFPAQRETPRDMLRALSRQLAADSEPFEEPTQIASAHTPRRTSKYALYSDPGPANEKEEEDLPPPPRLSINLNELDQGQYGGDDNQDAPPRLSAPFDEIESTNHSIELGRRAYAESAYGGRNSFGIQLSDRFADFNDVASNADEEGNTSGNYLDDDLGRDDYDMGFSNQDLPPDRMSIIPDGTDIEFEDGDISLLQDDEPADESFYMTMPKIEQSVPNGIVEEDSTHNISAIGYLLPAKKRPKLPISRYGLEYPPLPRKVVKRLAVNHSNSKISNETLNAIMAVSDAFFDQAGDDLRAYAQHAGRKRIDDADALQLLRRQRLTNVQTTAFSLAQKYLPRELLQELRMPTVNRCRKTKVARPRPEAIQEETAEDG